MAIDRTADLVTVAQWLGLRNRDFSHYDGAGKFVRDGEYMTSAPFDDVFGPIPPDATHIAWFNRWRNMHQTTLPPLSTLRGGGGG